MKGFRQLASENPNTTLAGVPQWIERWPVNQRVAGSIPSQGTSLAGKLFLAGKFLSVLKAKSPGRGM